MLGCPSAHCARRCREADAADPFGSCTYHDHIARPCTSFLDDLGSRISCSHRGGPQYDPRCAADRQPRGQSPAGRPRHGLARLNTRYAAISTRPTDRALHRFELTRSFAGWWHPYAGPGSERPGAAAVLKCGGAVPSAGVSRS